MPTKCAMALSHNLLNFSAIYRIDWLVYSAESAIFQPYNGGYLK